MINKNKYENFLSIEELHEYSKKLKLLKNEYNFVSVECNLLYNIDNFINEIKYILESYTNKMNVNKDLIGLNKIQLKYRSNYDDIYEWSGLFEQKKYGKKTIILNDTNAFLHEYFHAIDNIIMHYTYNDDSEYNSYYYLTNMMHLRDIFDNKFVKFSSSDYEIFNSKKSYYKNLINENPNDNNLTSLLEKKISLIEDTNINYSSLENIILNNNFSYYENKYDDIKRYFSKTFYYHIPSLEVSEINNFKNTVNFIINELFNKLDNDIENNLLNDDNKVEYFDNFIDECMNNIKTHYPEIKNIRKNILNNIYLHTLLNDYNTISYSTLSANYYSILNRINLQTNNTDVDNYINKNKEISARLFELFCKEKLGYKMITNNMYDYHYLYEIKQVKSFVKDYEIYFNQLNNILEKLVDIYPEFKNEFKNNNTLKNKMN